MREWCLCVCVSLCEEFGGGDGGVLGCVCSLFLFEEHWESAGILPLLQTIDI